MKQKDYNIKSFSEKKIVNKYCSHTDTKSSFGYHDGNTSRKDKKNPWLNSKVLNMMKLECQGRKIFRIRGDICQIPIVLIFFSLLILIFSWKNRTILIEKIYK